MAVQLAEKTGVVGEAERAGEPQSRQLGRRQGLGLLIGLGLQAVLGVAQKTVPVGQCAGHLAVQVAELHQQGQHVLETTLLQLLLAAAPDQLLHLDREFHVADAAGTQLQVVGVVPLGIDPGFHVAERVEGTEVQVAPVDERSEALDQHLAGRQVPGAGTSFDQRVALPVPAMGDVVVLHRLEVHGQRAAAAERPSRMSTRNTNPSAVTASSALMSCWPTRTKNCWLVLPRSVWAGSG